MDKIAPNQPTEDYCFVGVFCRGEESLPLNLVLRTRYFFSIKVTNNRIGRKGVGCAFFANENESLIIAINLKHEQPNITVICRSPTFAIPKFLEHFETYLTTIHLFKGNHMMCGDFNIDVLWSTEQSIYQFA